MPTEGIAPEIPELREPVVDNTVETPQGAPDEPVQTTPSGESDATEKATPGPSPVDVSEPAQDIEQSDDSGLTDRPPAADGGTAEPGPFSPPAPVPQPRIAKGPGFFTLLLGGVIAGGIGYAIAEYDVFDRGGPDPVAAFEARLADQTTRIDALGEQAAANAEATDAVAAEVATLRDEMAAMPAVPVTSAEESRVAAPDTGLADRLSAVEVRIDDLSKQLAGLPDETGPTSEELSALAAQVTALQGELDSQRAAITEATTVAAEASTAAADARNASAEETRRITVQGALAQLSAALENGTPYVDITSALETAGGLTIPTELSSFADSGVATLAALQNDFPGAARKALTVSIRETSGGSVLDRFGAFLRTQTGARSLDAREGDDPDAVLSRAEAAVNAGDLEGALSELAALPESGQAAMAAWSQRAQERLNATSALAAMAAATNSNQGRN